MSHRSAALTGLALVVPIGLLLVAVVSELEPLGAFLRSLLTIDGIQPSTLGRAYMLGSLLLLPVALIVAAWPIVRRQADGRRHLHPLNLVVVGVVLLLVAVTWGELAVEVVRCDLLGIPNCD